MQIQKSNVGLYGLLFKRLEEVKQDNGRDIIPFPKVFEKLCLSFSIEKDEC